jgi:predicted aspartyl protease
MKLKLGLILILLVTTQLMSLGQVPGFFMKKEKRKQVIPFLASNSLIIVPVSINGNPPLNFLIDTGVRSNLMFSKAIGDELGLQYTRKIKLMGVDGISVLQATVSPANTLDLGDVEGVFQNILVLDEDFLEMESLIGVPVYGIIGYEFFKRNPVKIDYDAGLMYFYRADVGKRKPLFYHQIDLSIEEEKPFIKAKILQKDGSELLAKLLIDTGANHAILLNKETSDLIKLPPETFETELGQSLGGALYGQIGRVNSLTLSALRFKEVLTSYPDENLFSHILKESGRQGSLGAEVLGRTRLIVDYPRNRLLMRKGEDFYLPFEFDMSGIILKKTLQDEPVYYVSGLRKDSPAALVGILENDEIRTVNKIPAFLWQMPALNKLFRSKEGNVIDLEIRRYPEGNFGAEYQDLKFRIVLQKQI